MRSLGDKLLGKLFPLHNHDRNRAPRDAWLEAALGRIPAGSRILDAGAGQLAYKKFCSHLQYVSQDFGQYSGIGNGKGLQTGEWDQSRIDIISDITDIPVSDASFDAVMCVEVFEHLPDPLAALKEFSRVVKLGGYLVLTAPFCAFTHFAPYFYGTGFSPYWYEAHLPEQGFSVQELSPNGNFSAYLMQEVARIPDIASRYAQVTPSLLDRLGLHLTLSFLRRMHASDRYSQEFVCFGYHVFAQKIG